jgi:hypothetical protein
VGLELGHLDNLCIDGVRAPTATFRRWPFVNEGNVALV